MPPPPALARREARHERMQLPSLSRASRKWVAPRWLASPCLRRCISSPRILSIRNRRRQVAEAERAAVEYCRRTMVSRPAARRRFVSIKTLGEIVRIMRDEWTSETTSLRRKVAELQQRVGFERRLGEVERMLPDFRHDQPPQLGQWSPEHSSWKDQQ